MVREGGVENSTLDLRRDRGVAGSLLVRGFLVRVSLVRTRIFLVQQKKKKMKENVLHERSSDRQIR